LKIQGAQGVHHRFKSSKERKIKRRSTSVHWGLSPLKFENIKRSRVFKNVRKGQGVIPAEEFKGRVL
jgi:hypothetical protein